MAFVKRSIIYFVKRLSDQLDLRKQRFDEKITPKKVFSFWFFVFLLGQIGIITSLIWAGLSGGSVVQALGTQGKSGNFLTFEISLLLSCLLYYFDEYGEEKVKELFFFRLTLLFSAMIVAFLAMLNYIYINTKTADYCWSKWFVFYNFILYIAGVILSYLMYITFSVVEKTAASYAKEETKAAQDNAIAIEEKNAGNVGAKKINL